MSYSPQPCPMRAAGQPAVRRTPAAGDVMNSDRAAFSPGTARDGHTAPDRGRCDAMNPTHLGLWIETGGRRYWVEVDERRTLHAAAVVVSPHDKNPSTRRLTHPATLARLQRVVRPPALCAYCGAESAATRTT